MKRLKALLTIILFLFTSNLAIAVDFPSLPNTFQPRQLISASKIMANYNALLNGMIDGSKKINILEAYINGTRIIDSSRNISAGTGTYSGNLTINKAEPVATFTIKGLLGQTDLEQSGDIFIIDVPSTFYITKAGASMTFVIDSSKNIFTYGNLKITGALSGVTTQTSSGNYVNKASGTAASPAIRLSNSTKTGVYTPSSEGFGIATNGTAAVVIDSSQNAEFSGTVKDKTGYIMPVGAIVPYTGTTAPDGWLICDGSSLLRAGTYNALWNVIGTSYGTADSTHFNVPDLRGRFLRGWDNSAGRDPDSSSRTAMNTGGNVTDNIGSVQGDEFESHYHTILGTGGTGGGVYGIYGNLTPPLGVATNTDSKGGNETRPINAYVNYIIKY